MSAKHFGYYDTWKTEKLTCPKCGWSGTFEQGSVEHHHELMDSSCPVCDWSEAPMLAIVSFPNVQETEAHLNALSESEQGSLPIKLKSLADLPDLSSSPIVLKWHLEEDQVGDHWTVISHEGKLIWSEPAVWEGYERFVEIVAILKRKYGERLVDVVPTNVSERYLFGDNVISSDVVERTRASLRDHVEH